ncbi:MAG: hypothetical protein H6934_07270 [Burkholderiaceae bacterium]|nr:hypothetical protein [Burkholderiaceae bacterium]
MATIGFGAGVRRGLRLVGAALVLVPMGSPAVAAKFAWVDSTRVWLAGVSGVAGNITPGSEVMMPRSIGLHRLDGWEHNDKPVRFASYGAPLDPASAVSRRIATTTIFAVDSVAAGSLKSVDVGSDRVATAVQVCVNNNRIKGVRLWARRVRSDGSLDPAETSDEYKRTNCASNGWKARLSCGSGKAIQGLRFHSFDGHSYSGIGIACASIR